jgi:hypothetical protein
MNFSQFPVSNGVRPLWKQRVVAKIPRDYPFGHESKLTGGNPLGYRQ